MFSKSYFFIQFKNEHTHVNDLKWVFGVAEISYYQVLIPELKLNISSNFLVLQVMGHFSQI